ncbi:MAG: LOG family protein [Chloroflexota bacterium]
MSGQTRRTITVFGASRVGPDSAEYQLGYELGQLLGDAGFSVCNGGSDGTMEAVAKGIRETGGRSLGVLVESIDGARPNAYIDDVVRTEGLLDRLKRLVALGEAYIVLPGGIGTLLELVLVWNLAQTREHDKPIILVGDSWRQAINGLRDHILLREGDLTCLIHVDSAAAAVDYLRKHLGS